MYSRSDCCECSKPLELVCGDDYLEADCRALVWGNQGSWPNNIVAVSLVVESYEGCGCDARCSITINGSYYAAGAKPGVPTISNLVPLTDCAGSSNGYAYKAAGRDPAATVPIATCDGQIAGYLYPDTNRCGDFVPVYEGCQTPVLLGYALSTLIANYTSPAGTVYPNEQATAWFSLTAAQTRAAKRFAGKYKVIGTTASGARVTLAEGAYL